MFSFLKNPFERLTAENQEEMKKSTDSMAESLTDKGPIFTKLASIDKRLELISTVLGDIAKKLDVKGRVKADAKEMKQMGETAKAMGEGMKWFVDALEGFAKIDPGTVDKFVVAIERIGTAFKDMEKTAQIISKAGQILIDMAKGVLLFGLALIVALPIYALAIPGAIMALTVIYGFLTFFSEALGDEKNADKIHKGAETLAMMGIAVILFGVAMLLVGVGVYSKLINIVTVVIFGIMLAFIVLFAYALGKVLKNDIREGVQALAMMGVAVILFGLALLLSIPIYQAIIKAPGAGSSMFLMLGVILGAVGIFMLLDTIDGNIKDGAQAMFIMAGTIIMLGLAIWAFGKLMDMIEKPWETMAMAGVALLGLALIMLVVGKTKGDVVNGALGMLIATGAILALGVALWAWQKFEIEWETIAKAGAAISGLALVMGIAGLAKSEIMKGALVMTLASLPLLALGFALSEFKKNDIGWDTLGIAGAAISGLAIVMGVAGLASIFIGLGSLAMIGAGLAVMAIGSGLQTFKKIGFTPQDADDFQLAMNTVIDTFTGISFKQALGMAVGVAALSGAGNVMTSLASGIQSFANMKFVEYEVVKDPKTGMTKIQPKSIVELSDAKIEQAALNFGKVVDAILLPIAKVGMAEAATDGWFSGGFITKGVAALTGVGGIMKDMAGGIQDLANLTFTSWEIFKDPKTGEKKIQPKDIIKLSDADFKAAGIGFGKIVDAILLPISNVGKAEMESSGWFSGGSVSKGIESLTGIGNIMSGMAKGVQDFANLTFTTFEVKDGKIQPKDIVKLTDADFATAAGNFDKITTSMLTGIINAGKLIDENEDEIEQLMEYQEDIMKFMKGVTTFATDWSKVVNPVGLGVSFDWFIKSVMNTFDPKRNPTKNLAYFMIFADKLSLLSKSSDEFEQMADSFERIADSMGDFKENLNGLDKDILTETRGLFDAMAVISKSDGGDKFIKKYSESLKKTFETLATLLEDFKGSVDKNTAVAEAAAVAKTAPPAPGLQAKPVTQAAPQPVDMSGVINAIKTLQATLTTQGIKVKNDTFS